jgi:hypothetical protein
LEKKKEYKRLQAVREIQNVRAKTARKNDEEVWPERPARQSGILQAALQAPEPEDAQKNEAIFDGKEDASALGMGAQQVQSTAARRRNHKRGEQECDAANLPGKSRVRQWRALIPQYSI